MSLSNPFVHDIGATILTFVLCLAWLRLMDFFAHRKMITQHLSRKLIHIGTGPLFLLCWLLYSSSPAARWLASLVPLAITAQFALVGLGIIRDPAAVQAMSRSGDRKEILRGPLYYGIVFIAATLVFWRESPVGILALMLMCGGDGLADVVGRNWGIKRIPWNTGKSWFGSLAMFAGSLVFSLIFVFLFNNLGYYSVPLIPVQTALVLTLIALVATVVESLPIRDVDNITTTLSAIVLSWLMIQLGLWSANFL
jgi:phytol kinase